MLETQCNDTTIAQSAKILIVDDEKTNCDVIFSFLFILGVPNRKAITDFAYNGLQALDKVQQAINDGDPQRYSLILMDCNMPFMDGYTATQQIRQLFKENNKKMEEQPMICAITGHVEKEYVDKALASGMDKVFQKPLPIADLGEVLVKTGFISQVPARALGLQDI